jgi:hypothetical protein
MKTIPAGTPPNGREQVNLAMAYYSSHMILNRPCLAELDIETGTNIKIPRTNIEDETAKACVHFALALISILPDVPDIKWVAAMTSWWPLLHTIIPMLDGCSNTVEHNLDCSNCQTFVGCLDTFRTVERFLTVNLNPHL